MALIGRLTLSDGTLLLSGTHDPSSTGTAAPVGSLFLRVSGTYSIYQKTSTGATDWSLRGGLGSPAVQAQSGGGVTTTIDLSTGPNRQLTLNSASTTLSLDNPTAGVTYTLAIIQGSGSQTVTWPGTVKAPGGTLPTLSTGAGAKDLFRLYYDGTIFWLETVGLAFA